MVTRFVIPLLLILFALPAFSQKIRTVEGEYTYVAPENVSLEEAKRIALDRAKIQALADEFGMVVSQTGTTVTKNEDGKSTVDLFAIGGSEVKGEWIENVGSPTYKVTYEGESLVVYVKVTGKAREIVNAAVDLQVHVLRNGTEDKFESSDFKDGDDLYLSFVSPVSGYLTVYLADSYSDAFCLLPYQNQTGGIYNVEANRRYVFFNAQQAPSSEKPVVDEYTMTCSKSTEQNVIYVIFSPEPFTKAADAHTAEGLPRTLAFSDFQKWLVKCRKYDGKMNVLRLPVMITK